MSEFLTEPVPHKEGAAAIRNKPAVTRAVFDQLAPELQARAFVITGIEALDVLARVRDMSAHLVEGGDWDEQKAKIKKELSPFLITSDDPDERAKQDAEANRRSELLLRTHGWQTYADTQFQLAEAHIDVFPYRQYLTSEDSRVRPSHAALDRKIFPANHIFWHKHTPPWEWSCRCDCVVLTADEVDDIRASQALRLPENRWVLPPEQLAQVEQGRLVKPGAQGFLDLRTPREKTGKGYEFCPADNALPIAQILERYTPQQRKVFEDLARKQKLEDGRTLFQWWHGQRVRKPKPAAAAPEPGPAPADDSAPVRKAPVSAGVNVRAFGDAGQIWKDALAIIDTVHDDGDLPGVDAIRLPAESRSLGEYNSRLSGQPVNLALKPQGSWPHLTGVHEIGHYLDHHALGSPGKFATADPAHPVQKVLATLKQTKAYRVMSEELEGEHRAYFQSDVELWARAYAQFIAEESGDPRLANNLRTVSQAFDPWRQWTASDFAPARAAIREMFQQKGWMKP